MVEIINGQNKSSIMAINGPILTGGIDFQREHDPSLANTEITTYQYRDIALQKELDLKKGKTIWRSMFNADFTIWKKDGLTVDMPANLSISQDDATIRKNTKLNFEDPPMQDLLNKTVYSLNLLNIILPKPDIKYEQAEVFLENLFQDKEVASNSDTIRNIKRGDAVMIVEDGDEGRITCTAGKVGYLGAKKEIKRGIEILSDIFRKNKATEPKTDSCQNKIITLGKSALQITYGFVLSGEQQPELHINKILKATKKPKFPVDIVADKEEKRFLNLQNTDFQKLKEISYKFSTRNLSF
jgi:hypothetical protein